MNTPTIYTATPADLSPPVQTDSFCVDLVLATDHQKLKDELKQLAAENAFILQLMHEQAGCFNAALIEGFHDLVMESGSEGLIDVYQRRLQPAIQCVPPTPATDRIVAMIKADAAVEREKTIIFTAAKKRTQDGVALIAIGKPYRIHNDDVIGEFFIGERGRYGVITMDCLNYFTTSDEYAWEFSLREGAK
ncbi:hypothetical protein ACSQOT_005101 [Klebsiella michiganensis]